MDKGWIKLYRELLNKAIWQCSTPEQKTILITLLLMANHKENEWEWQGKKFIVQPGQFITSSKSIETTAGPGISRQNVRTALEKFEKYGFLTKVSTKTGILVTITNWEVYQSQDEVATNKVTIDQPTPNQQVTTNKNDKNDKNVKNYKYIVEYLNQKTGKSFSHKAKSTTAKIHARLVEGFTVDDFKKVIDIKTSEWLNDANMQKYLRPETLFGTKFEGYLNQSIGGMKLQKDKQTPNQDHTNHNYDMDEIEKVLFEKQIGGKNGN